MISTMANFFLLLSLLACTTLVAAQSKPQHSVKYFIFREDCFDLFFTKFDFFSNKECIAFTISKGLGLAIIAGSAVLKVPQILKIFKSRSVEGISKYMFYTEILMLMHSSGYSI